MRRPAVRLLLGLFSVVVILPLIPLQAAVASNDSPDPQDLTWTCRTYTDIEQDAETGELYTEEVDDCVSIPGPNDLTSDPGDPMIEGGCAEVKSGYGTWKIHSTYIDQYGCTAPLRYGYHDSSGGWGLLPHQREWEVA